MKTNRLTHCAVLVAAFALPLLFAAMAGCLPGPTPISAELGSRVQVNDGYYTNVNPPQLAGMLKNKDFTFINVHIPYDGEIEKTDLFVPYDRVKDSLGQLPRARDARIVVYCRSGPMSSSAASDLIGAGYTNVFNLDGGMTEWKKQGYELISKK
ncbi:MAG: rhodanese-like domain-containing protein [Chloroflexi bacterium]|nr:rhodanese-like domain-containing protein [Chloroflexota bacterium]